jgi:hypothetical protein
MKIYLLEPLGDSSDPEFGGRHKAYQFVDETEAESNSARLIARFPNQCWEVERIEQTGGTVFLVRGTAP